MKNLIFLVIIISWLLACKNESAPSGRVLFITFADSLFHANVDSALIAGASVLVFQQGQVLLDKSYGYASLELSVPMPEHASFEIGSVTKQFTAAAILRLVEQGKISLEDDFTKYVDFNTKGRTVTINHLLNHTSGIQGYTEMSEFENLSMLSINRDTLLRLVEQKNFLFEPGQALIYNNTGYFILGLIIIKVSGMPYIDYLKKEFFQPLGMNNTYYCSTSKVTKNKAYGYSYSKEGLRQKEYLDHTWPFAAGSLCSTTSDLLIWMSALHGGKVLHDSQYTLLTTPGKLKNGSQLRYAMALTNYSFYGNHRIGHGGGINGFLSDTRFFPDADLHIICLVNTTGPNGASFLADQLTWKLLKKAADQSVALDVDLQSLEGMYVGPGRGQILSIQVSVLNGGLLLKTEGENEPDTLQTYLGNNTWVRRTERVVINRNELHIDQVGGYYILQRIAK